MEQIAKLDLLWYDYLIYQTVYDSGIIIYAHSPYRDSHYC